MRIGKRRIVQVLLVFVIVGFALRESRILWGIEELKYFDLGYWGIEISSLEYTLQNMISFWGGVVVLILLSRRGSPKVRFRKSKEPKHAPSWEPPTDNGKGREQNLGKAFKEINPKWKVVLKNPKAKGKTKNGKSD